ncbi:MAG: DUF4038 domain-containing protein [bacterium]
MISINQWQIHEITFTSTVKYANPYADVDITAAFTGPDGAVISRPAFWDGGDCWRVRFAPTKVGNWNWVTVCNDDKNAGLHCQSGTFECVPYTGTNPNYCHGYLQVSENGRYLCYADGLPFFWLGDTHWQMPDTERIDECNHPEHNGGHCPFGGQFQHLAAVRRNAGFNVYQTYPSISKHWWNETFDRIDPKRFQQVFDYQMDYLAEQGFVIALGFGHFNSAVKIPSADLCRWARYLVARYGAHPVVWITCQEISAPEDMNKMSSWLEVAAEIERADSYCHPHSGHQWVLDVDERPLGNYSWHDWFALQGGHRGSGLTTQARYAGYYNFSPAKPMIETEAMYEQVDCGGIADENDARMSAWKAILCGSAGYTYGAAGVWALKWDPADKNWKDYNHEIDGWYAGIAMPGAEMMTILKEFFIDLPWTELTPRLADPTWVSSEDPEKCVLTTIGNELYLAYFYGESSVSILKQLNSDTTYTAKWFDPRTGKYTTISTGIKANNGEWQVPEKPAGDWVLELRIDD